MNRLFHLLFASLMILATSARADGLADVTYVAGSSQKLEQFIGDTDLQTGLPTLSQTKTQCNLANTDLGVAFYHHGRTFVLFGDSDFPGTADALGYTTDTDPESGLALTFYKKYNFSPILIPNILHGAYDVPIYGLSSAGKLYLYYSTDADAAIPKMGRTVVAVSTDDGVSFSAPLYTLSSNRFINVSVLRVNCADWPGLPQTNGLGLLIFGSGYYRQSEIYLAFQPETDIETNTTIRYLSGADANNNPQWSAVESNSIPLTSLVYTDGSGTHGVGEMSATFNVFLKKWLLLFNLHGHIQYETADQPWGPYSTNLSCFSKVADHGFNYFIYKSGGLDANGQPDTYLCDPNVTGHDTNTDGDIYGPYVFGHFTAGSADEANITTTLYHSLSTWNPYNSVLMKTRLVRRVPPVIYTGARTTNTVTTAMPGGADAWAQSGTNADSNFGTNPVVAMKNNGAVLGDVTRKAWLRFPLNLAATQRITSAALSLTVNSPGTGTIPHTYQVYGLRYSATNQNWNETNLTWNNAPGNDPGDGLTLDFSQTILLGAFTTPGNRVAGQTYSCSSVMLKDFLNQSAGGPVTLILSRLTVASTTENFAARENTSYAPPTLTYVTVPKIPDQTITRNFSTGPILFKVDSTATNAGALNISASSSNLGLVPTNRIVLSGSGTNRTVTILPATNQTGSATITLAVNDGLGAPDVSSFVLNVSTNHPPTLAAISNIVISAGTTLSLANTATDPDVPAQTLSFSLLQSPTNAQLNASNGLFIWRPAIAQVNSSNPISLLVTDNGSPSLSATQHFAVLVGPPNVPSLSPLSLANGQWHFHVAGLAGPDFTLQASTNLLTWTNLYTSNAPALPFDWTVTEPANFPRRFYRLLLGP